MAELIPYLVLSIVVVLAVAIGLAVVFSAAKTATGPILGVYALAAAYFLEALLLRAPSIQLGLQLYPQDLVLAGLFAIGLFRTLSAPCRSPLQIVLLALLAVDLGLFAVGAIKFGTAAGVEYRPFFYLVSGTIYFSSFQYDERTFAAIQRAVAIVAIGLLLLAFYRWASDLSGLGSINWGRSVGARSMRVLSASATLFLLCALFLEAQGMSRHPTAPQVFLLILLLLSVVVLQHRTVWVSLIAGTALLVALRADHVRWVTNPLALFVGLPLAIFLAATAVIMSESLQESLSVSVFEALQEKRSTLTWRISGWQELIRNWASGGIFTNLFGYPFGTGWRRYIADVGRFTDFSPHSFWIQALVRGGIVKVTLMLTLLIGIIVPLVRTNRKRSDMAERAVLLATIVLGFSVYLITYGAEYFMGIFLGISVSLAGSAILENQPARNTARRYAWTP